MQSGTLIDYTVRATGFPVRWTTLITDYEPPYRFVDVQLKGPYSFWHHTHTFEAVDGGTMIKDTVRYVLPFGILGRAVHRLLVRRQLRKIFEYRQEFVDHYFTKTGPVDQASQSSAKNLLKEV
jgi:ligand-binding SRPBCC domain-containing protein